MDIKIDCKYYLGEKPCQFKRLCPQCPHYKPLGKKIGIIKLGALGDALRTSALLSGLRREREDAEITWITDASSHPLLEMVPGIDRLYKIDFSSFLILTTETFDLLFCLDKEPEALAMAMAIPAREKRGFARSPAGRLTIFNQASSYALELGINDPLKFFENKKTYQEIIYEMAEIPYQKDRYILEVPSSARKEAASLKKKWGVAERDVVIGLNTGSGEKFLSKQWNEEGFVELCRLLLEQGKVKILLLGGAREENRNNRIAESLGGKVISAGSHSLAVFAGIVEFCDVLVSSDSLAMHIAIALSRHTVAFFGPTSPAEIDLYEKGRKILGVEICVPCYLKECRLERSCVEKITPSQIFQGIVDCLKEQGRGL